MDTPILLLVVSITACCGCGQYLEFTPASMPPNLSPKDVGQIQVLMGDDKPSCSFATVGSYLTAHNNTLGTRTGSIDALKKDAAERGFDGIYKIECAEPGTKGQDAHECSALAFVCKK